MRDPARATRAEKWEKTKRFCFVFSRRRRRRRHPLAAIRCIVCDGYEMKFFPNGDLNKFGFSDDRFRRDLRDVSPTKREKNKKKKKQIYFLGPVRISRGIRSVIRARTGLRDGIILEIENESDAVLSFRSNRVYLRKRVPRHDQTV